MSLDGQQKKVIFITTTLIVILLLFIIILAWQKNNLLKNNTNEIEQKTTSQNLEFDTNAEKTAKQEVIEKIAPNTDLGEFDIPDRYLNEQDIVSYTLNRNGNILSVDLDKKQLTLLSDTFEKEKEYNIIVSPSTKITIEINEEIHQDTSLTVEPTYNTVIKTGTISDIKINDYAYVEATSGIGGNEFTANTIYIKRSVIKLLNE